MAAALQIILICLLWPVLLAAQEVSAPARPAPEVRLDEARRLLLSVRNYDLEQDYRFQMEKALVLLYQAANQDPAQVRIWLRLGRLAEIRSLWAEDIQSREDLLEEARGHFMKAASLSEGGARPAPEPAPEPEPGVLDPFMAELLWSGRLRRGEISGDELARHHSADNINPLYRPDFWSDLFFLIQNDFKFLPDPPAPAASPETLLSQSRRAFAQTWAVMPMEVPRPGSAEKLKKLNILLAWTETLLKLAASDEPVRRPETAPDPGLEPGPDPGSEPGPDPGSEPGPDPGSEPGSDPGPNPGPNPGLEPGSDPGPDPGPNPGSDPGSEPGPDPGSDPGPEPGSDPGSDPGPEAAAPPAGRTEIFPYPAAPDAAPEPAELFPAEALFGEVLDLFELARKIPLSRFEIQEILARLDRAESFCPSAEASDRLWKIKDEFHALFLKASGNDSAGWLAWGQDYCRRADRQASDRLWEQLQAEAAKKLAKAAELSPDKAEAFYQWGRVLEFNSYLVSPFLSQISPASQAGRLRKTLTEARNQYEKAYSQENRLQYLDSLARVSLNLAKQEKKLEDFKAALAKAVSLGHQAVRGAGSSPRAWLAWGRLCLDSPASLPAAFRPYLTAEGFSAYNRWLLSNPVRASELIELADEVWTLASQHPGDRDQALSMLIDICRRLVRLAPQEPGYGFALGLTVLAQLSSRPAWPDDPAVTNDLSAKRAFLEVLKAYQGSLEGLSLSPGPAPGLPAAAPLRFLAPEVGIGPFSALASYPERLALAFNRPAGRLLAMARPETLPPWYQYQLASFLRLAAASGYLPEEEQMAYWRLALHYLRLAKKSPDTSCLAAVLAEEGLVLAELNLLNSAPDPSLLYQAENLWQEAEKLAPDSSRYARARWAAWQGERAALEDSLRHPAALEDSLVWPAFEQGSLDPAFRPMHREAWFKKAWFGYSR